MVLAIVNRTKLLIMKKMIFHNDIEKKTLQDFTIPSIGFGTYELSGETCRESVLDAIELGYRHIDTAQMYHNEIEVGMAIKESGIHREDLFLTDKIWFDNLAPEDLKHSFVQSLEKLKTDYIDLLLIHWPSPTGIPLKETILAMQDLQKQKVARWIGVSNFTPNLLKNALTYQNVICDQVEYHPFLSQEELLNMAVANGLFIIAYSPIARGEVFKNKQLASIGQKYGKTAAQVSLRWLIQHELVVAIPRSSFHEHRKSNLDIFDFQLTEEDMNDISSLAKGKRLTNPDFAPNWN